MKTCKDCIHYDVCAYHITEETDMSVEECASGFKDKERYVELPCHIGDTMYKICTVNSKIKMGGLWDGRIVEDNCDRCGYRNCHCYDIGLREKNHEFMIDVIVPRVIRSINFAIDITPYVGTIWFRTEEEAARAIAERRGISK